MIIQSLKERYKDYFDVGGIVWPDAPKTHGELIKQHFSTLTCENMMKPEHLLPERGRFTFEEADKLLDYALQNSMKMRGHALVWHNQTPGWFFEGGRDAVLANLKEFIRTVVGRYKGKVFCWDALNEVLVDSSGGFLRKTPYLEIIGEEYIDIALQTAHDADPDALLFYNEYNECEPEKRDRIVTFVKGLKERGLPIHGIGMQAHWYNSNPDLDEIRAAIEQYAALGMIVHVTELELSVFDWEDHRTDLKEPLPGMLEKQAERYGEIFELFREYKDVVRCVTTWGVADDYTWLDDFPQKGRKNWPLLFDVNHRSKPALERVLGF